VRLRTQSTRRAARLGGTRLRSERAANHDAVVVGSGINSLACAALLARGGWSVLVLEREDELGGAIRTAELTEPGYLHDVFSAWHPLWVGGAAHAELGDELAARGLEYLNTDYPTATLFPDGEAAFLLRTADANAAELDRHAPGDGDAWRGVLERFFPNADLAFGVLGTELWSKQGVVDRLGDLALGQVVDGESHGQTTRGRSTSRASRKPRLTSSSSPSKERSSCSIEIAP